MSGADNNRRTNIMARTIRTKVYKFNELSEQAKERAINDHRNDGIDTSFYWDEAHESVKAFHELFGTEEGNRSWLDVKTEHLDDNLMNLKGLRLRTYIINNFSHRLFKGKYFSLWSKKDISFEHYKDGYPVLKTRYSKVIFDNSCVLTGVCHDDDLLQPVYEFLNWKLRPDYNSYMDFETLMNDCFESLRKSLESEDDYRNSDEAIKEELEESDAEFTQDGRRF